MGNFMELKPIIYRVVKNNKDGFDLKEERERYTVKKKLYGPVKKILYRIDRLVKLKLFNNISIISTGKKGLGKTTTNNKVCNTLLDNGIPVIEIKYIDISTSLIEFLSNFRNVVIYIDEFGKYFNNEFQDKTLTLLNKTSDYYNIFLLGENETYRISSYLLDRMERIKYHLRHDRISGDDLKECCTDYKLSTDIYNNLKRINDKSSVISYDTLEVLAEEHKLFPELSFEELTSVMNCQGIIGISVIDILDVQIESDKYIVDKFNLPEWSTRVRESSFIDGVQKININIILSKIEKEEKIDTPNTPYNIHPMNNGNSLSQVVLLSSSNIVDINDLDGVITTEIKISTGEKLTVILGSKLVPSNA